MATIRSLLTLNIIFLLLFTSCSSSDQEQMEEPTQGEEDYQQENMGQNELQNGEQASDFNEDSNSNNEMAEQNNLDDDQMNNLDLNETEGDMPNNSLSNSLDNTAPSEPLANSLEDASQDKINESNISQGPGDQMSQGNMTKDGYRESNGTGGRVFYISANNTPVMSGPSESSEKINVLNQGDHVLVWAEGDWGKTQNGQYLPMKYLSSKGIARERKPAIWR